MQDNNTDDTSKKRYFVFKLIPPRSTFAEDMTEEERDIMTQHAAYWTDKTDESIAIVFGPVLDPKGVYGLGIIEVENEDQVHTLAAKDPAVESGLQRLEIYPMRATLRK
ncbi:MAG: YciI family protein [Halobacteriota archaeon]